MKPHKISTHLAYSDNCYFHLFFIGCLIELKFCKVSWNSISKWTWKFQLSILKNKKVLFLKKNLSRCQYQNKKALFTDSIFLKVFGLWWKEIGILFVSIQSLQGCAISSSNLPTKKKIFFLFLPEKVSFIGFTHLSRLQDIWTPKINPGLIKGH